MFGIVCFAGHCLTKDRSWDMKVSVAFQGGAKGRIVKGYQVLMGNSDKVTVAGVEAGPLIGNSKWSTENANGQCCMSEEFVAALNGKCIPRILNGERGLCQHSLTQGVGSAEWSRLAA